MEAKASLGQKTFREYTTLMVDDIALNSPPAIFESFEIDPSYRYGVGLSIVVDRECVTREVIEEAIDQFMALGCKAWRATSPVTVANISRKTSY